MGLTEFDSSLAAPPSPEMCVPNTPPPLPRNRQTFPSTGRATSFSDPMSSCKAPLEPAPLEGARTPLSSVAWPPCPASQVWSTCLMAFFCPSLWWDHVFGALDGLRCTGALSVAWAGRPPAQPGGLTVPSSLKQMSEPASGASFSEG